MKIANLIYLFLLLLLVGCPTEQVPEYDSKIYLINNSQTNIVYNVRINESWTDTALWESYPWGEIKYWTIDSGEVDVVNMVSEDVKSTLEDYYMHYYFFYADTLSAYPWDVIRDEYKVAKRVTISSWEEYEAMDFTIEFP